MKREKLKVFEELLEEIVQIALQSGLEFGPIQIVDSVHSIANVNTDKDRNRKNKGGGPRDPDARWRVKHKKKAKQVWLDLRKTPQYRQGLKERYKVERKFGEVKQWHGLGRCCYLGRIGFAVQSFFTVITLNLKRSVMLLTGIGFKTRRWSKQG